MRRSGLLHSKEEERTLGHYKLLLFEAFEGREKMVVLCRDAVYTDDIIWEIQPGCIARFASTAGTVAEPHKQRWRQPGRHVTAARSAAELDQQANGPEHRRLLGTGCAG